MNKSNFLEESRKMVNWLMKEAQDDKFHKMHRNECMNIAKLLAVVTMEIESISLEEEYE